ncbi:MAG: ribosome biogenesis factor YjgA [Betaproteobacteria bacterium]
MSDDEPSDGSGDATSPLSKTKRKNAMHDLQELGKSLVALDPRRLAEFDLPERLADAIRDARTITRHEARRRQMQYIGRLMRDVDAAPIAETLARLDELPRAEKLRFAALEAWRDRLLDDDAALAEYVAAHPRAAAFSAELAQLIRTARAERAAGAPPHKFRQLFRRLKDLDIAEAAWSSDSAKAPQ